MTVRAAIYVRISEDRDGTALGVGRQEEDCRALCTARGWEVAGVYADNDVSAYDKRKKRPAYERMMSDLRDGVVNALAVYNIDRLYRQPRELNDLLDMTDSGRVLFASVGGEYDLSTTDGRFMARLMVDIAEKSSADTSRRQKRKARQTAELGQAHGGTTPYGFEKDRATVIESEAAVIRRAVDAILGGASLRATCIALNADGIPTKQGRTWSESQLSRMLVRPRYTGKRVLDGVTYDARMSRVIITDDEHAELVARLTSRRRPPTRGRWLLSGFAYCGLCGTRMSHSPAWTRGRISRTYRCQPKPIGCGGVSVVAEPFERYIRALVAEHSATRSLPPGKTAKPVPVADVSKLVARLAVLDDAFAVGDISPAQYRSASRSVNALVVKAEAAAVANAENAVRRSRLVPMDAADFDALDREAKRATIAAVIERITVNRTPCKRTFDPARLAIVLREDEEPNGRVKP